MPAFQKRIESPKRKLTLSEDVLKNYCVWQKLNHSLEIGGFGRVIETETGWECDKIWLLTTSHSGGSMHITAEAMAKFVMDRFKEGEDLNQLYLHWHTHDCFNPFFSATDLGDIKSQLDLMPRLITVVFSTPQNCVARYNTRDGFFDLDIFWYLSEYLEVYNNRPTKITYQYTGPKREPTEIRKTGLTAPDQSPLFGYRSWSWAHWELDSSYVNPDGPEFIQPELFNSL